ncbi:helix-turn-helix transcriptional regulator [Hydrogenophaga sp.]|uniref:helix-turn-helix transcriptional regulator n=1 Tax=Hydrogenophaga sp. TaxID=1904254 RepID=UPI002634846E|nr:helix-turn-helix transcriptional regulator [Hydrogenophaga sp.]
MKSHIKDIRLQSGKTQAEVADTLGVSQSTYKRWESGAISPSGETLQILANIFETTVPVLLGQEDSFDMTGVMGRDKAHTYYGEVAIHFQGLGKPLLLPICQQAHELALQSLQTDSAFLSICSLDNRAVFIRRDAIADIYFSSDACDEFGPHGMVYDPMAGVHPDFRFWQLVDELKGKNVERDFPKNANQEWKELLAPSSVDVEAIVAEGTLTRDRVNELIGEAHRTTEQIFDLATTMYWQMGGVNREAYLFLDTDIYSPLMHIEDAPAEEVMGTALSIDTEGWHRTITINPKALDYISVPLHRFMDQKRKGLEALDAVSRSAKQQTGTLSGARG